MSATIALPFAPAIMQAAGRIRRAQGPDGSQQALNFAWAQCPRGTEDEVCLALAWLTDEFGPAEEVA